MREPSLEFFPDLLRRSRKYDKFLLFSSSVASTIPSSFPFVIFAYASSHESQLLQLVWTGTLPFSISGESLRYSLVLRRKGASDLSPYFLLLSSSGIASSLVYWTKSPLCHDSMRDSRRLVCQSCWIFLWHFGHFESSSWKLSNNPTVGGPARNVRGQRGTEYLRLVPHRLLPFLRSQTITMTTRAAEQGGRSETIYFALCIMHSYKSHG